MKKIIVLLTAFIVLTGCSITDGMDNTPTKKVENYLNNYQTLDEEVLTDLDEVVENETTFTDEQKEDYKDILKKHYQNLTYTIKEETVNGDTATVEVEIEVSDFAKILDESNTYLNEHQDEFTDDSGLYSEQKYNDYRLDKLKDAEDKVKYTIYFNLTKESTEDDEGEWTINELTETDQEKILGIYKY